MDRHGCLQALEKALHPECQGFAKYIEDSWQRNILLERCRTTIDFRTTNVEQLLTSEQQM